MTSRKKPPVVYTCGTAFGKARFGIDPNDLDCEEGICNRRFRPCQRPIGRKP